MSSREFTLAILLVGFILLGVGGAAGYMLIYSPLQEKKAAAQKLQGEVDELELKVAGMVKAAPQVAEVKRQSLPPDPVDPRDANKPPTTFNVAKAQYKLLLERLLHNARITNYQLPDGKLGDARPPVTPEMSAKKPAYTRLIFTIDINRADVWQIADFLYGYYQLDLLHQITDLRISRENKPADPRGGLKVSITSEAIVLDGAEPRSTLFPVTTAVAAVAGIPGLQAVVARPEMVRKLTPVPNTPVLASRPPRDYSLIALRDVFYGPIPPPQARPPFALARIPDVVLKRDEKPTEVPVKLSGLGSEGGQVVAVASGSLLPEGELKVDPRTNTITIPAATEDMSDYATSTVSVLATSADGKTLKGSFKVSVEHAPPPPEKPKDDIAAVIKLIIVSTRSDGSATAVVFDAANPYRYVITGSSEKGVVVARWRLKAIKNAAAPQWDEEVLYRHSNPGGLLLIEDDGATATKRTFKVVAIEDDALIVADVGRPEPPKADAKQPRVVRPGAAPPPAKDRAEPLAVVAGNLATAIPPPTYYRWGNGKSLKDVLDKGKLPPEEVSKILRRVAAGGPVVSAPLAASGN
jgi:hypothetical protein